MLETVYLYILALFLIILYSLWELLIKDYYGFLVIEEESEDEEEEEDYDDGYLILLPGDSNSSSIAGEDDDTDDDLEEDEEEYEVWEALIPVEMMSPAVSNSIFHGRPSHSDGGDPQWFRPSGSCEPEARNQENRGGTDGLFCPICFEAWTSSGSHQICCLPCGHIYGLSCIKKWLQSSLKCPQCNGWATLEDVRLLYAAWLCVADEELHERVQSLEAKCADLEEKVHICIMALAELNQQRVSPP